MGGYSLTLIDALSSFVVLGDKEGFEKAVKLVADNVTFDIDAKVQVFEVTIRVLGGLVSCTSLGAVIPGLGARSHVMPCLLLCHALVELVDKEL